MVCRKSSISIKTQPEHFLLMVSENSPLSRLEDTYTLRILATLLREGKVYRSVLYTMVSRSTTAPKLRVDALIKMGLVRQTENRFPPYSKTLELTEKGKKVAELVTRIEKILE